MNDTITKAQAEKAKRDLKADKEFDDEVMDAMVAYFMDRDEMPYGTKKARDGDPHNWTADKLGTMPNDEIEELIDSLVETRIASIADRFQTQQLQEGSTSRGYQLRKNLDALLDGLERFERITRADSVTAKMVKEQRGYDGDVKQLKDINDKIKIILNRTEDLLMTLFIDSDE